MTDLKKLSAQMDTSVEILRAIVDQQGDERGAIEQTLEHPENFDALVVRAREYAGQTGQTLRWQGRQIM